MYIVGHQLEIKGFIISDPRFRPNYPGAIKQLAEWVKNVSQDYYGLYTNRSVVDTYISLCLCVTRNFSFLPIKKFHQRKGLCKIMKLFALHKF